MLEAKRRLEQDPRLITSHTVLVVDLSAIMRKSDMNGHRTRSRAVFYTLAEEFVASRLSSNISSMEGFGTSHTDVVTLIAMRDTPSILFSKEPISWLLYNQLLRLAENERPSSHGDFYPSIEAAFEVLERADYGESALAMYFLSDGRPSDGRYDYFFPNNLYDLITKKVKSIGHRFTFFTVGFGSDRRKFEVLEEMVKFAKDSGAASTSFITNMDATGLVESMTSFLSMTSSLRNSMSCIPDRNYAGQIRKRREDVQKEKYEAGKLYNSAEWIVYTSNCQRYVLEYVELQGIYKSEWKEVPMLDSQATGIAVKRKYFAEGAERIVYELREVDVTGRPVGMLQVAKDSKFVETMEGSDLKEKFHKDFISLQMKAENMAEKFNRALNGCGVSADIPRIRFLPCSVYVCNNYELVLLAEQRLPVEDYKKYNDNAGRVIGTQARIFQPPQENHKLEIMTEEEEEDEEDEEEEVDQVDDYLHFQELSHRIAELETKVVDIDVPQTFSHFSYVKTSRNRLVCDLQGVLTLVEQQFSESKRKTKNATQLMFLLTDPCIHDKKLYKHKRQHRCISTNMGEKGMRDFFRTHNCNALCEILKLGQPKGK